ncbi:plastocyanin/azurin family copper-binding protein [Hoyosella sp. YIM 151337]|uniref:cupredoxin domain-containing protein n=1 Tax=Hoyosella sp. YIM 151337 TaxID=2992742 RepID=UPI002235EA3B|nr:plastocyanin/azurin family copper-binding protein [Hoyosella sp. YIM 151337]MCW4355075.1 plastocyanin/azurin family copper-binding protein [Hoyosella sp. YIM 151337]
MNMRRLAGISAIVLASALVVSCGDDTTDLDPTEDTPAVEIPEPMPQDPQLTETVAPDEDDDEADDVAASVRVENFAFDPPSITVSVGDTVEWVFADGPVDHDVTGQNGAPEDFQSPVLSEDTWTYTFTEAGEYDYICSLHPNMTGTVVVEE